MKPGVWNHSLSLWLGGAALALLIFLRLTRELMEGEVNATDTAILHVVAKWRAPWLTGVAMDVTALGSITLVVIFSIFTLLLLLALRDRMAALQLLAASVGAGALTWVTKDTIERIRPAEAERLVIVSGFSYPSGHSVVSSALYLTIAIVASRYVRGAGATARIFLAVSAVILMVGASRVYLGVHYPTDVLSGFSLGGAWAFILAGLFARFGSHHSS